MDLGAEDSLTDPHEERVGARARGAADEAVEAPQAIAHLRGAAVPATSLVTSAQRRLPPARPLSGSHRRQATANADRSGPIAMRVFPDARAGALT